MNRKTRLTDRQVVAMHDHEEMMLRPHLWPIKGKLPLKHKFERDESGMRKTAVLFFNELDKTFAVKRDWLVLFKTEANDKNVQYGKEELIQELLVEGWEVD